MHNPHFDISGILGKQLSADIAQQALGAIDMPAFNPDVRKIADLGTHPNVMKAAQGVLSQQTDAQDHLKAAMSGLGDTSTQMASLENALNLDAGGTIAERLYKDYGITDGILGKNYAAQAVGALGKDAAFMGGVPKIADLMGGVPKIADLMNDYNVLPADLMGSLVGKVDFFNPKSLRSALDLAEATPQIKEKAAEFVREHPDEVEKLAEKVTGRPAPKRKSEKPKTGHLSNVQRLNYLKEALDMIGQIAITSFSSGQPAVIVSQVTLSVIVFVIAVVAIEKEVRESQGQAELEEGETPADE